MKLNYLVVHQIPSSYFTFSRCNWNWRKMEVKKRRLSSNSQGCCCMELSIQAGSQSLPSCRCKWKLRTPSTCPEHWDWALTMSNLLTMADRKTLLAFCFSVPPYEWLHWCCWFSASPKPWAGPVSTSLWEELLLHFCTLEKPLYQSLFQSFWWY